MEYPHRHPKRCFEDDTSTNATTTISSSLLSRLIEQREWAEVAARIRTFPQEVLSPTDPVSSLALACRYGAPVKCIEDLLYVAPGLVRRGIDSRGTPLHEAINADQLRPDVIAALVTADCALGVGKYLPKRALLTQDVDGLLPLHVLIRRHFQQHVLDLEMDLEDTTGFMEILKMLVVKCPEAVVIPDNGECSEPPIIYAITAPTFRFSEDRAEESVYDMVDIMLTHYPKAACEVFTSQKGQYTALHAALVHGGSPELIDLLLWTDAKHRQDRDTPPPALVGNARGEVPLHLCIMRNQHPTIISKVMAAAPRAIFHRDRSGLTPFHWLWIRFGGSLLGTNNCILAMPPQRNESNPLEQVNFEDMSLEERSSTSSFSSGHMSVEEEPQPQAQPRSSTTQMMDPPVDFRSMRHIPPEIMQGHSIELADEAATILQIFQGHRSTKEGTGPSPTTDRKHSVTKLFWSKVVSLLQSAALATKELGGPCWDGLPLHTAFSIPPCPPEICRVAAHLFPKEMCQQDNKGRLPLHYAAIRPWHELDWPFRRRDDEKARELLEMESLRVLDTAISLSPAPAFRLVDTDKRLALHHAINTFVIALCSPHAAAWTSSTLSPCNALLVVERAHQLLKSLIDRHPESLQQRDGVTMLFPFQQATALASEQETMRTRHLHTSIREEFPLSITYTLLRNDPTLLSLGR